MIDSSEHFSALTKMIERLAAGEHEQWAVWAQNILDTEPRLSENRKARWPGLIATPYDELSEEHKDWDRREVYLRSGDALAEIERLRAEKEEAQESLTAAYLLGSHKKAQEMAARIKELEDAHKRAGAKYAKIIRELRSSVYANIPGLKKQWDEVLAEGKIGNGDHIVETDQMIQNGKVWQITEERKAAIDRGMRFLAWSNANTNDPETELDLVVLRAMLEEAE